MSKKIKNLIKYEQSFIIKSDILYESIWVTKFIGKFIKKGKKHLVEKNVDEAFSFLKFKYKRRVGKFFTAKIEELRPLFTIIKKRIGRQYKNVPFWIKEKKQLILSLSLIHKCVSSFNSRLLSTKITLGLSDVFFGGKKSYIKKRISEQIKLLSESRFYLHLRW